MAWIYSNPLISFSFSPTTLSYFALLVEPSKLPFHWISFFQILVLQHCLSFLFKLWLLLGLYLWLFFSILERFGKWVPGSVDGKTFIGKLNLFLYGIKWCCFRYSMLDSLIAMGILLVLPSMVEDFSMEYMVFYFVLFDWRSW